MGSVSIVKKVGDILVRNSPHILTAVGCAGVVSTAIFTGKATIKAYKIIEKEEIARNEDLDLKEKAQLTWKLYLPSMINGGLAIACIIGANTVNSRRQAALAGLYSIAEVTLRDYREKVVETIGKNKEERVMDEVVQKRLIEDPVSKKEIILTGKGETLCYDSYSGRYFKSDIETIRRIVNDLNHDLMGSMWVPINDLYFALGLGPVKLGEEIGWTTDELIDVTFTTKLSDTGEPCLVIDYNAGTRGLNRSI